MKPIISDLVTRYETGRLSRRDLIQGLTMLVATAAASNAAARSESVVNFRLVLQCTHGIGVRPAAYLRTKSSMTSRRNGSSKFTT